MFEFLASARDLNIDAWVTDLFKEIEKKDNNNSNTEDLERLCKMIIARKAAHLAKSKIRGRFEISKASKQSPTVDSRPS